MSLLNRESANAEIKRKETGESLRGGTFFLFRAPQTFRVPFSFSSSPLSESLEQARDLDVTFFVSNY